MTPIQGPFFVNMWNAITVEHSLMKGNTNTVNPFQNYPDVISYVFSDLIDICPKRTQPLFILLAED